MKPVPQQFLAFALIVLGLTIWGSVRHDMLKARTPQQQTTPHSPQSAHFALATSNPNPPPAEMRVSNERDGIAQANENRDQSKLGPGAVDAKPSTVSPAETNQRIDSRTVDSLPFHSREGNHRDFDQSSIQPPTTGFRQLPQMPQTEPISGAAVLYRTGATPIESGQPSGLAHDQAVEGNDAQPADVDRSWPSNVLAKNAPEPAQFGLESHDPNPNDVNPRDSNSRFEPGRSLGRNGDDAFRVANAESLVRPASPPASHEKAPLPFESVGGESPSMAAASTSDVYPLGPHNAVARIAVSPDVSPGSPRDAAAPSAPIELAAAEVADAVPTTGLSDRTRYRLAAAPDPSRMEHHQPVVDPCAIPVPVPEGDFSADPIDPTLPDDPFAAIQVYEGKKLNATQRPLIELGRRWYDLGQLPEPSTLAGFHNPITPQFIVFGDLRTAVAANRQNGGSDSLWAWELNLNMHLQLTGTERLAAGIAPLDDGVQNTRLDFENNDFIDVVDADFDFGFFEGDLGAIVGGWTGETLPFDLPFAVGVMPMLVQNGVWMEDNFLGAALTIPARNVPRLGISNMDVTFLAGFDEILSPAFENNDDVAKLYGMLSFVEAWNGYLEFDYAYLEDRDSVRDRSYHNIGIGFTRRYGRWVSNSTRVIVNAGQSTVGGPNTADGVLLLSENSLITRYPSTVVPYFNLFAGFDRPQSAARNGNAGGVLRNTGILFESDGMTGYPTLDATANDTFGAALGLNLLAGDFSQQLIVEAAAVGVMGDVVSRNAPGSQFGIGFRHQIPISNSVIIRTDGMLGFLKNTDDISGLRIELRHKF